MGAVMGSKKLKAIAVRGKTAVKIADAKGLTAVAKWVSGTMDEKHRAFHEFGTGAAMQGKSLEGGMPTLNYRLGAFDKVAQVDAIAVRDQMRVKMEACYACSVRCKKVVHIEKREDAAREAQEKLYGGKGKVGFDPLGRYSVDPRYGGPEYESLAAMGVNLGLDDIIAITQVQRDVQLPRDGHRVARLDARVGDGVLREGPAHAGGHRRRPAPVPRRGRRHQARRDDRVPPGHR